jgi:hypothetical protein
MTPVSSHAQYDHLSSPRFSASLPQREKLASARGIVLAMMAGIALWTLALAFALFSFR